MKPVGPRLPRRYLLFFGLTGLLAVSLWLVYARTMLFPPAETGPKLEFRQGDRGPIFDRGGRLLAVSTRLESASVWKPDVKDLDALAAQLAPVLGEEAGALRNRLRDGPDFQYLKRRLSAKEAAGLRELKAQKKIPGVKLEPAAGRSYPEGDLAGALVGYVGLDNIGLAGIEYTFNDVLAPASVGDDPAPAGASVWLTIDSVLQQAVQTIADQARRENQASRVSILVSEAATGELAAWVSSPGVDPNQFSSFSEDERSNPILTRAYEPGSVFKVFSISTLLDAGAIRPSDTFDANGAYEHRVAATGELIRIKDLAVYGRINVGGILEHSSNAGTGYASDHMDAGPFEARLRSYGFGRPTGITLNGETPGLLRPASTWSARSKPTIAMGQEVGVSALQIVQAASALANGGKMLKPLVVRQVISSSGEVLARNDRTEVGQVISPQTAGLVLGMLQTTVEEGTGRRARVEGYDLAGKTGTAQVRDPKSGRYSDKNYLASVLLYLPAQQPRYIIYLTIENPMGASYLGGQIAAPVGKQVAEKLIQLRALPKSGEAPIDHPGTASWGAPPVLTFGDVLPDLRGLPKRSLLPLLNRPGLRVDLQGEGWVVRQQPPAGTPLTEGLTVTVELE